VQASRVSELADRERDIEELKEELELMQSVNKLADQANRKLQDIAQESTNKIQSLEVSSIND